MRALHAVALPPGPRLLEALTAALDGSGPALLPVAPGTPAPALSGLLEAARPAALVDESGVHPLDGGEPTEAAVLIATSGSTGRPKVVELTAGALESSARATLARVGAQDAPWLCCLPTSHIAGVQVLVRALLAGTPPVIHPGFDLMEVAKAGEVHVSLVPTQLRRLLDVGADLSSYASILLGGAAAPSALLAEAKERGARIFTTYGMSETSGGCVYDGVPLEGVEVALDADGRIALAGPVLFAGYRFGPRRSGPWFTTQDLGVLEDGRLRVLGRVDDVINTGGEKVVAGAVAEIVSRHPAVREAVVVGRADPEWGARVTAVVVADGPVTLAELRDLVRAELPAHAAPRELEIRAELPLLPSGKPDREALRAGPSGEGGLTAG
ncbi:AMP-binding protein [Actinocorallia sp. A-T 12471]|uniref:AMP-binding protein n=1 Tax=Actinocorallia sp. A-T 12471 TaxID=3089813 RepID=UPI0029CBECEE|nr:AMP-binding protein [Actinocorallia sp. A-T 12471]MDX6739954.1 AMP-binding protein [Actinocorallia sp. A-T 12471]